MKKMLLSVLIMSFFWGTMHAERRDAYSLVLTSVTKVVNGVENEDFNVKNQELNGSHFPINLSSYEDSFLAIDFVYHPNFIESQIGNVSNSSFRILWDESSVINHMGMALGIFHSGIKINDRNNSQTPTVVPKGAKINDNFYIKDLFVWFSGTINRWVGRFWFEDRAIHKKPFSLILVFEQNQVEHTYTFLFEIVYHGGKNKARIDTESRYVISTKANTKKAESKGSSKAAHDDNY